jgi:hypothetical protein
VVVEKRFDAQLFDFAGNRGNRRFMMHYAAKQMKMLMKVKSEL